MRRLGRVLRGVWASPATALGVVATLCFLPSGATVRVVEGVIETAGGGIGRFVSLLPRRMRFSAITLGQVILGTDHDVLAVLREHEHVHVRQYERWGVLFLPAYLASSLGQMLRGADPYRDNRFEREAYARSSDHRAGAEPKPGDGTDG